MMLALIIVVGVSRGAVGKRVVGGGRTVWREGRGVRGGARRWLENGNDGEREEEHSKARKGGDCFETGAHGVGGQPVGRRGIGKIRERRGIVIVNIVHAI